MTFTGFDLAFRMLHAVVKHKFMELQQDFLRFGHVVEVQTAGSTMIFTDEPEIFKAVMSTKVSPNYVSSGARANWKVHEVFRFWKREDSP